MSFKLPAVKPQVGGCEQFDMNEGHYGIQETMAYGLTMARSSVGAAHPVQLSEKKYDANKEQRNMSIMRNIQGLHAPLRISMELQAAEKIGRLPFLPSSGFMKDVLTGRDEELDFKDIFNMPEFREQMCQPHATVEKRLGIL